METNNHKKGNNKMTPLMTDLERAFIDMGANFDIETGSYDAYFSQAPKRFQAFHKAIVGHKDFGVGKRAGTRQQFLSAEWVVLFDHGCKEVHVWERGE